MHAVISYTQSACLAQAGRHLMTGPVCARNTEPGDGTAGRERRSDNFTTPTPTEPPGMPHTQNLGVWRGCYPGVSGVATAIALRHAQSTCLAHVGLHLMTVLIHARDNETRGSRATEAGNGTSGRSRPRAVTLVR